MRIVKNYRNIFLMLFLLGIQFGNMALAEDKITIRGKINAYDLKAQTLAVTVEETNKDITFVIQDDKALHKLGDRLFVGDKVRVRYTTEDGKNVIKTTHDLKGMKPGC